LRKHASHTLGCTTKQLEIPDDEEEVNTREIHKCDGQVHDPDTMVSPLTSKSTRKSEALTKTPPTITLRHEEEAALKKWSKSWLCFANGILETIKANLSDYLFIS
jgi:hypothetical protein